MLDFLYIVACISVVCLLMLFCLYLLEKAVDVVIHLWPWFLLLINIDIGECVEIKAYLACQMLLMTYHIQLRFSNDETVCNY